ncbi:MAG: DUF3300 domain-containing protein, partial [Steroidobacteraceae bacterium]
MHSVTGVAAALLLGFTVCGLAQEQPPPTAEPSMATGNERLAPAQLDQLTAPIALYPDPLLGLILASSTYPLEVVEAARWLDDPAHAALKGDALGAALQQQSWDPSVKSLMSFPDVLRMMNSNLEWTEQLGDAFLAQQADVMDSVQRLRQRAAAQGSLRSTPQQIVSTEENAITIEPASPDVVYVPYYVPAAVYGPWPWPDYAPYYFPLPPDVSYDDAFIGFGIGIGIFEPLWGWYGCNWPGHGVVVYPHYPGRPRPPRPRPWQHDPAHRQGVPYRDPATAVRYLGSEAAARRPFRGYPSVPPANAGERGAVAPFRGEAPGAASPMPRAPAAESRPMAPQPPVSAP